MLQEWLMVCIKLKFPGCVDRDVEETKSDMCILLLMLVTAATIASAQAKGLDLR